MAQAPRWRWFSIVRDFIFSEPMEFRLETDALVVALPPHFTMLEAAAFGKELRHRIDQAQTKIILDATDLVYLDSFGIGSIVEALRAARGKGGDLRLRNLSGEPLNLIQRSGLDRIIPLEETESPETDLSLRYGVETNGNVEVFRCAGMISFAHDGQQIESTLRQALSRHKALLLDLKDLKYMDSETIGRLMSLQTEAAAMGKRIGYCSANPLMKDLFLRLGLAGLLSGFETLEEAIKGLS